jgi:hypothetical protein
MLPGSLANCSIFMQELIFPTTANRNSRPPLHRPINERPLFTIFFAFRSFLLNFAAQ